MFPLTTGQEGCTLMMLVQTNNISLTREDVR